MTQNAAIRLHAPDASSLYRRDDVEVELESLAARQRETRRAMDADLASVAAIKASRVYRLTQMVRRIVPRPSPSLAPPPRVATSSASGTGGAFVRHGAGSELPAIGVREEALSRARAELFHLEEEARRVHHELHHLQMSRPRRLWIAARRRLVYARHPFWTLGAALRVMGTFGLIGGVRTAWHRFRWNTDQLRFQPLAAQQTDQPHAGDAIRWLPPVRISGQAYHALFMHPRSSVRFRTEPPAGARVITGCALLPKVWGDNRGGVEFELDVTVPGLSWQGRRTIRSKPGERFADRRWRLVSISLPAGRAQEVVIGLSTRLPGGASGNSAWSVWSEPRIEWRRSTADMWRSVRALAARVRHAGLIATLRQIRDLQASDGHAALYRRWVAQHTPTPEALAQMAAGVRALAYRPCVSVITPIYNTDPRWLRACIESVRRQVYPDWQLCLADDGSTSKAALRVLQEYENLRDSRIRIVHLPRNMGISAASNAALDLASGEFLALLDHDDELAPEALYEVVRFLNNVPDADWIYSDEDKLDAAGERCDPYFKPDWSPEHFRSTMYSCHLMVLRASLVREVDGFRRGYEGAQDYDLALRVSERSDRIHHLPLMLYRWRKIAASVASSAAAKTWASDAGGRAVQDHVSRCGLDAVVLPGPAPGLYRVRHRINGRPLVSIILPTDGRSREVDGRNVDLLENCVRSIVQKSTYDNYEIVIADNGVLPAPTRAFLETVPHRLAHFDCNGSFNYARKLNFAVRHSRGEQLLLFNDDIEIITPEWLEAMLEFSQQQQIGAVGARLLYPDGRLQHIGVVMGVCGMAAHAFHSHPGSTPGHGSSALIIRNYSAVTAACMMTRRDLYERLNGFDERFTFDFNDTDYCLRLRREGYRIVYTPYAELYHLEAATFGARTWNAADLEAMRREWADVCERDPYYNPHLTRDFPDYRVRV
jgi:glycosyltransferase involved in cell wall biosynthesis